MDQQQFDAGVLAQIDTIRRIGRGRLRQAADLDDFTQEVVIRLYAGRDQLRDSGRLAQWTSVTARNLAVQWNRRRAPIPMSSLPDLPPEALSDDDPTLLAERWQALVSALETLDPVERDLLVSYYVDEVGYTVLQQRHGLSYSAVGVRLHRAKRKLRTRLGWLIAAVAALFHTPRHRAFGGQPMAMSRMSMACIAGIGTTITGAVAFGLVMSNNADATAPDAADNVIQIEMRKFDADPPGRGRDDVLHLSDRARDGDEVRERDEARETGEERRRPERDSDRTENDGRFGNYEAALQVKQDFDREVEQYREGHDGDYPPGYDRLHMKHEFMLDVAAHRAEHGEYPPGFEDQVTDLRRKLGRYGADLYRSDAPLHHDDDTPTASDGDDDR